MRIILSLETVKAIENNLTIMYKLSKGRKLIVS